MASGFWQLLHKIEGFNIEEVYKILEQKFNNKIDIYSLIKKKAAENSAAYDDKQWFIDKMSEIVLYLVLNFRNKSQ